MGIVRRHLSTVARHKWFVLVAGIRTKAPLWRLIIHDWSKLTPVEVRGYSRHFYGGGDKEAFTVAWLHHQHRNPHHWEHWLKLPSGEPIPMPLPIIREMVADWLGASRAYEGKWPPSRAEWPWLAKSLEGLRLHPFTRARVDLILDEAFS